MSKFVIKTEKIFIADTLGKNLRLNNLFAILKKILSQVVDELSNFSEKIRLHIVTLNRSISKNRTFLYATEFFAGMSVMAVELGASRLLAPYFSSSQIVWTIIIGTIMIAMASGNVYGGRIADKNSDPALLYRRIIFSAIWIAAIPVFGKYFIIFLSGILIVAIDENLLIWSAFLSCITIFATPLFLLGTVTPCLVKYATNNLDDNGKIVGNLGAFQTIGSIIGTFLPTFMTIPAVGTAVTFLIFSGILFAIGVIYFIFTKSEKKFVIIASIIFIFCSIFGNNNNFAFWKKNVTYEGESIYNYLQVYDTPRSTILSTNVLFGVQSIKMKEQTLTGMYYDYALAAPVLKDKSDLKILILGNGAGTFAGKCLQYFPNAEITGVEIDEKITDLSKKYFDLPEKISVITYDGRAFLQTDKNFYDIIFVDAYQDITIPFQMSTVEFFKLVQQHLISDGIMVLNMNLRVQEVAGINDYICDTVSEIFSNIRIVDAENITNRILFASSDEEIFNNLSKQAAGLQDKQLSALMKKISLNWQKKTHGKYILSDDKAPVELLGIKAIDKIIKNELKTYKEIYRKDGFGGMLKAL